MRRDQRVAEIADEVLARQARDRAKRTGNRSTKRWRRPLRPGPATSSRSCATGRMATRAPKRGSSASPKRGLRSDARSGGEGEAEGFERVWW